MALVSRIKNALGHLQAQIDEINAGGGAGGGGSVDPGVESRLTALESAVGQLQTDVEALKNAAP